MFMKDSRKQSTHEFQELLSIEMFSVSEIPNIGGSTGGWLDWLSDLMAIQTNTSIHYLNMIFLL